LSRPPKVEMINGFIEEVESYLPSLVDGLKSLKETPDQHDVIEETHRLVHIVKGASSMVGLTGLSHIAFQMEEYLDDIISGKENFSDKAFNTMHRTIDMFEEYCRGYMDSGVASRAMLKETVEAFRNVREHFSCEDGRSLTDLLASIPEYERLDTEDVVESERDDIDDLDLIEEISAQVIELEGLNSSFESGGENHGNPDELQTENDTIIPQKNTNNERFDAKDAAEFEKDDNDNLELIEENTAQATDLEELNSLFLSGRENIENPFESQTQSDKIIPQKNSDNDLASKLMESFYEEAEEHLEDLGRSLNALETEVRDTISISPSLQEEIRRIRRSVHTLKGAAAVIGFHDFSSYAHGFEDLLDWLYEESEEISPEIVKVLIDSSDLMERIISSPTAADSSKASALRELYLEIMGQDSTARTTDPSALESEMDPASVIDLEETSIAGKSGVDNKDPEISEKILPPGEAAGSTARFSKTLRVDTERVDDLVNLGGELIIALSALDQKMEIFSEAVNDIELARDKLKKIASDLEVSYEVRALEKLRTLPDFITTDDDNTSQTGRFDDFDALELDRYSELNLVIRMLNESAVDVGALHTQLKNLHIDLDGHLTRQRVILSELQDKMMMVRMTPFSFITNKLRRTVREVAGDLDKEVKLIITGETIELDRLIWEKLTDPLMHLLRNAVDHGVEPKELRQTLGKPSVATVKLDASREGNQVVIRIMDDGAGLDYHAIKATALRMQLSDNVEELSEEKLTRYIFYPGFSTRTKISEVSGRGVGMDVVKKNIQDLKGVIRVDAKKGIGTQFTIRIPLTLASMKALLFTAGTQTYAIALNDIREIIHLDPESILGPSNDAIRLKDEVLPLFNMLELLNAESEPISEYPVTLVLESGGKRYALVIDSLVGQKDIVIKSLGAHLRYVKGISGATIMGDGSVVPILNIDEFVESPSAAAEDAVESVGLMTESPLEIMVVDDSVSIRQVVSRLMENQGWKVRTAKDGIDALEKLRESRPHLIVLDIEMPRMNGYEFLGALKAQTGYADIPVVMLTSRTAAKHRKKAEDLGAKGFVVKPYNDDEFIRLIHRLTGKGKE
jgi:chemosensory pili system protein ChpA (sensor histidine kinase/response regulator)